MAESSYYGMQLGAGLGMIPETARLLELWRPGMTVAELVTLAMESGAFPSVAARRLRNIVSEAFAPRLLIDGGQPAAFLKVVHGRIRPTEFRSLLFIYTCRANPILGDFVREVFWNAYAAGARGIGRLEGDAFVQRVVDDGRTRTRWSEITIVRMSQYVLGACVDFGLLGSIRGGGQIQPFRITPLVVNFLAHDLHFKGLGDNAVVRHQDWALFGLATEDVLEEMKRLALSNAIILQSAGAVTHIAWKLKSMGELADVLAAG